MNRLRTSLLMVVAVLGLAGLARAATIGELTGSARVLLGEYVSLAQRVMDDVEDRTELRTEFEALEMKRAELHRLRGALDKAAQVEDTPDIPIDQAEDLAGDDLDDVLGDIDDQSTVIKRVMGDWEETE